MKQKITFYYDKQCPFCSKYANFLKLKENFEITLKDARENLDEISLICGKLDINDGFIVVYENHCFQGSKALAFLNSAVDKTTFLHIHIVSPKLRKRYIDFLIKIKLIVFLILFLKYLQNFEV